ncbi:transmembrane protein 176 isoform X1 [Alosa sapidissima]|uniref:transmembrane protein 176 isoform X1 n=1 Tax=Alosa sapidissima TaxID=34773 RepID=UPI001C09B1A1|nr:transmembrane protein 176 isoform X1 [Alosa sapidissima]
MAVSISRDLSVTVGEDVVADKLADKQALLQNFEKSQSKALGVSQLMLGLLVMMNSIPLLFTDYTEILTFGVPLWSGLVVIFLLSKYPGCLAITLEKYINRKYLFSCVAMSAAAVLTSATALIIYFTDITKHPAEYCASREECSHKHYAMLLSTGVKTSLAFYTMIQTIISIILTVTLYKARKHLDIYERISS